MGEPVKNPSANSWVSRARRAVASTEALVVQNPQAELLKKALSAFERAEHAFDQARYLRASSRAGAGAEADQAHREGRAAYTEGEAAWDAYRASAG